MNNWDEIKQEWETTKITLATLAEKHDIKLGTLKSRKSREAWTRGAPNKDAPKNKKVATNSKRMQPKKEVKEPVVESDELTEKQRLFCIYYIKYFNATKAYQKAYDCAYTTARVEGHRHLTNPNISEEIDRMKAEQTNELKLDIRDVLQKYIDIAFADITDYLKFGREEEIVYNEFGQPELDANSNVKTQSYNYVHLNDSSEIDGTILTEVKQGKDGVSIKLADKMKALDKLSLYFDLFPDKFQREVEEEKLKIAHHKAFGANESEDYEDDGFNEALNATTLEVWGIVDNNTEED
ncbi:terminase small subunit [Psychrobacillus psychrodurans]|uniref:terminase small subunit n=1 Tax=Psychrobacillus psychrodurans TaxID=126157 RepID=UPI001F4EDE14|nr:terminase small subunit [Psychrobacillus psychrodurans]MCK1996446.1 terminase small subunit [Psychrobacillus psychrodurans]